MADRVVARACVVVSAAMLMTARGPAVPVASGQANVSPPPSETIRLPHDWQLSRGAMGPMFTEMAVSPNGRTIAFSASPDGSMEKALLHVRSIDGADANVLPGTTGACMATFSPDGQWIAYWGAPKILKVSAKGGAPVALVEPATIPYGLVWTADDRIVFGTEKGGLSSVPASGGKVTTLTTIDAARESSHRLPHAVAGARLLLFTSMASTVGTATRVEALSLDTGKRTVLVDGAADARYLPGGYLLFVRQGILASVRFDATRVQVMGTATTVLPGVMQALNASMPLMNSGAAQYAVSDSGTLMWVPGGVYPDTPSEIFWVDRRGHAEAWRGFAGRSVGAVRLSPDGTRVAANATGFDRAVLVYDSRTKRVTRVTPEGAGGWFFPPFWAPDGGHLAFGWWRIGHPDVWQVTSRGPGKPEQLLAGALDQRASTFTSDGRYLALVEQGSPTGPDIKVLRTADRQLVPFAATKATEIFPEFSPDGRWLAFVTNESGRNEVYVRSFPDGKKTLQLSRDGGMSPLWGRDGRELFYWDIAFTRLLRVAITPGQNLSATPPEVLFEFPCARSGFVRYFDISLDGQRFLVPKQKPVEAVRVTEFHIARDAFKTIRQTTQSVSR